MFSECTEAHEKDDVLKNGAPVSRTVKGVN